MFNVERSIDNPMSSNRMSLLLLMMIRFLISSKKHTQTHKNKNKTKKIRSIKESKYSDYNFVNVRHLASNDKTYDSVYSNTQNESLIGFKLYVFFPMEKKIF